MKLDRIILVDDDHTTNFIHHKQLRNAGLDVQIDVFQDGLAALQALSERTQESKPCLIFLDLNMPKINGWEFLKQYKRLTDQQRAFNILVVLTTSANPDDIRRAKNHSCVAAYLTKPLLRVDLEKIISQHFTNQIPPTK